MNVVGVRMSPSLLAVVLGAYRYSFRTPDDAERCALGVGVGLRDCERAFGPEGIAEHVGRIHTRTGLRRPTKVAARDLAQAFNAEVTLVPAPSGARAQLLTPRA